jgi:hypothetical protein
MKKNAALLALAVACLAPAPLLAQTAKAKPAAVSLKVTVTNGREAPVTTLAFTGAGASQTANLLKKPLPPGKSIVLTVKTTKGACLFDIAGSFADEQEIAGEGIDLCKDNKLTLVE